MYYSGYNWGVGGQVHMVELRIFLPPKWARPLKAHLEVTCARSEAGEGPAPSKSAGRRNASGSGSGGGGGCGCGGKASDFHLGSDLDGGLNARVENFVLLSFGHGSVNLEFDSMSRGSKQRGWCRRRKRSKWRRLVAVSRVKYAVSFYPRKPNMEPENSHLEKGDTSIETTNS